MQDAQAFLALRTPRVSEACIGRCKIVLLHRFRLCRIAAVKLASLVRRTLTSIHPDTDAPGDTGITYHR